MIVLALAFHIDDIQSTVIGSLVGLIVPLFARNRLDARVGAFVGFLLLQISAYTARLVIGFMLCRSSTPTWRLERTVAALALPLRTVAGLFRRARSDRARALAVNSLLLDGDVSDLRLLTKGGRLIC